MNGVTKEGESERKKEGTKEEDGGRSLFLRFGGGKIDKCAIERRLTN